MATDTVMDLHGELSKLSDETIGELNAILPPFWSKGNPVDVLGDADSERYASAIKICLRDREVDGLLAITRLPLCSLLVQSGSPQAR